MINQGGSPFLFNLKVISTNLESIKDQPSVVKYDLTNLN